MRAWPILIVEQAPENHVLWANRAACHGCLANWVRAPTPPNLQAFLSLFQCHLTFVFLCYFARAPMHD